MKGRTLVTLNTTRSAEIKEFLVNQGFDVLETGQNQDYFVQILRSYYSHISHFTNNPTEPYNADSRFLFPKRFLKERHWQEAYMVLNYEILNQMPGNYDGMALKRA